MNMDGIEEFAKSLKLTPAEGATLRDAARILQRADPNVMLWEHCNSYQTGKDVVGLLEACYTLLPWITDAR